MLWAVLIVPDPALNASERMSPKVGLMHDTYGAQAGPSAVGIPHGTGGWRGVRSACGTKPDSLGCWFWHGPICLGPMATVQGCTNAGTSRSLQPGPIPCA